MSARGVFDDSIFPSTAFLAEDLVNTTALASGIIPVNLVCGANEQYLLAANATALTLPSAAAIYAQLVALLQISVPQGGPGVQTPQNTLVGGTYRFRLVNSNAGTLTLTAGAGITFVGTAVVPLTGWRDYVVTITSPTTLTFTSVGSGTN